MEKADTSASVGTWIAVVVVALMLGAVMAPIPASAQVTDLGDVPILDDVVRPRIKVARDFSASYSVSDTLLGASYTIVGTAAGYQSRLTTNGVVLEHAPATATRRHAARAEVSIRSSAWASTP